MKALIYYGPKELKMEERPVPSITENDVLVKVVRAGICGSDLTAYRFDGMPVGILRKGQFGHDGQFGHEMVGVIEKVGEKLRDITIGDAVFINPTTCKKTGMLGCDIAGAFSEYVSVEDAAYGKNLFKLPPEISFDEAVLIEPLAVGTHAKNCIDVQPYEKVVIYGAGTIGLASLGACLSVGCVKPVVADVNAERLEIVRKLGGQPFLIDEKKNFSEFLSNHFGEVLNDFGMGSPDVDAFIDAAGAPNIPNEFSEIAKKGARLSMVAIHKKPVNVNAAKVLSNELVIKGSCGYEIEDVIEAYNHILGNRSKLPTIVTHHYPHDQALEAFATADDSTTGSIKVVIDYS